jgi:hypothetical protein
MNISLISRWMALVTLATRRGCAWHVCAAPRARLCCCCCAGATTGEGQRRSDEGLLSSGVGRDVVAAQCMARVEACMAIRVVLCVVWCERDAALNANGHRKEGVSLL